MTFFNTEIFLIEEIKLSDNFNSMLYDIIYKMKEYFKRIRADPEHPEERIENIVNISYDGKQYLIRIPTKISEFLAIHKDNKLKITLDIPSILKSKHKLMVVEVIEENKENTKKKEASTKTL